MEPKKSAIVVCHCQNDLCDPKGLYSASGAFALLEKHNTLPRLANLLDACRKAGVQVFYINNEFRKGYPELGLKNLPICIASRDTNSFQHGTWGVENPDIIKPHEEDIVIVNHNTSAFSYTNLDQILRAKKIEDVYLAGIATSFVIDSSARYGAELGYNMYVIEDCCESWTQEMHDFHIKNILPQFSEITNAAEMIKDMNE